MMKNRTLYGTAAAASARAAAAALGAADLLPLPAMAQEAVAPADMADAVEAAAWADNVTITLDAEAETFRFQSDGIPSHGFAEAYLIPIDPSDQPFSGEPAEAFEVVPSETFPASPVDATITTRPVLAAAPTDTSLGRIGVAITGALIFNDYENAERTVVAQDDQVIHDHVAFLDECNGHTLASGTDYHYHGIPVCITEGLDAGDAHSVLIGVLADGFPVYGNHGEGGAIVTNADLDECSGHFSATPELPEGIYHYHLTADEAPYMIDCYSGEVEAAARTGPGGSGPDFEAAAATLGIEAADLMSALGTSMPPDFDAAAEALGISVDDLRAAMPAPPR